MAGSIAAAGARREQGRSLAAMSGTRELTPSETAEHLGRIAEQGYTIVEDAIELVLLDEIAETLDRLEVDLGIVPARNAFDWFP